LGRKLSQKRQVTGNSTNSRFSSFWICLLLSTITIAVFWQVLLCGFVAFDDDVYVLEEKNVTAGLTWRSILWAFTSIHSVMWHPLTSLSHIIDYQLFKDNPFGHHMVNLLLHTVNVVILFLILKTMTGSVWPSAFVAALFAVHPLQIESVAWVAERKNLISGLFWLLTIGAYIRYARRPTFGRYLLVALVFCLALISKPMVVTLPFVFLLLDYWPLRRIALFNNTEFNTFQTSFPRASLKRLILEKIPFFVPVAVLSIITFNIQKSGQAVKTLDAFPLKIRIFNTIFSYVKYIEKMFYPTKLAVFYPYPSNELTIVRVTIAAALLLVISIIVVRMAKSHKYMPLGWFWFLGVLVPVIGLVQVGMQGMADRYAYLPFIGLFIIIAWGVPDLISKLPNKKIILISLSSAALLALSIHTYLQLRHWRNSIDLFEHAVKVTEDNYMMHNNLCVLYNRFKNFDKSIEHGTEAVRVRPDYGDFYYNLGIPLYRTGKVNQAIKCWERSVSLGSRHSRVYTNLASLYYGQNKIDLAVKYLQRAIEIDEDDFLAHAKLGLIMTNKGQITRALDHYQHSLKANPNQPSTRYDYALLLENQNQLDEAIKQYKLVLKYSPNFEGARKALDNALQKQAKSKTLK
jgi:tetratricopeptide (TPR) repeat protein